MHEYEIKVINELRKIESASLSELAGAIGLNQDKTMWAVENLRVAGLVAVEREKQEGLILTQEGKGYLKEFPEETFAKRAAKGRLKLVGEENKIAVFWAKRNGWISIKDGFASITKSGEKIAKGTDIYLQREVLQKIEKNKSVSEEEKAPLDQLIKRGLITQAKSDTDPLVKLTDKGMKAEAMAQGIGAITRNAITNEEWKNNKIRPYDINADYEYSYPARLHPMHEFINIIRNAWLRMGFVEVSGPIIESSFWNFDALFSPQDHPTRDMQDTFFLSNPKYLDIDDVELLDRVSKMHTKNWKATFNEELSKQALLRTQTTTVSVRNIQKFATAMEENYPLKLFSVGKVFRNETIDYKHLAEFHQIDGIIIGNNLNLSNLMHTLKTFYGQLGMEVRFRPSYFPFVEPGMEVSHYNKNLGEYMELAGSGIIRGEITKAMGTNKTVLAWGCAIDRPIMDYLKIDTLMELYKNDLRWLRNREELEV